MEKKNDGGKKVSWWDKKSKSEKRTFIVEACVWSVGILLLILVLFSKEFFGQDFFGNPNDGFTTIGAWFVQEKDALIKTAIGIVVAWMIIELISIISKAIGKHGGHKLATVMSLVRSLLKWVVIVVAVFVILGYWSVDTSTLLASLGIVALIVGLGCQSLIQDIVAGMFLVFDEAFEVGDIVTINDFRGTVSDVGIKSTRLVDAGGNVKIVSNSKIASVINLSKELSVAVVEIPLAYEEDIQRVEAVIAKALPDIQKALPAIKEGPYYKGISVLDDSVVQVKFVAMCKEEDVYQLQRDLNRAFLLLFFDNHIECKPYDRVVVNDPNEDYEKATKAQAKTADQFAKDQADASKGIEPVNK
jgi:moderate conductance mechanosensitive channel